METSGFQSWAPAAGERELDRAERESAARRGEAATGRATLSHEAATTDVSDEVRRVFASSLRALGLNAYASVLAKLRR